jgi:hypothetical protein
VGQPKRIDACRHSPLLTAAEELPWREIYVRERRPKPNSRVHRAQKHLFPGGALAPFGASPMPRRMQWPVSEPRPGEGINCAGLWIVCGFGSDNVDLGRQELVRNFIWLSAALS